MGLFTKSRPDTQRILAKGKNSNKALVSQILQLRNSSSNSSSYDDADDADILPPLIHQDITAGRIDQSESKKPKKKKKVWRVLKDDSVKKSNAYFPTGIAAPTPIDPFATEPTTLVSLATNTSLYNQAAPPSTQTIITVNNDFPTATKLFTKKKFQRLDSMDDGSLENVQQSAQQPLIQERISKQSNKSAKPSSMKKNKNLLSKHIKPSSFSKMHNDDTPRSNSVGGDAIYYPPPTIPIVPIMNVGITKQDTTTTDSTSDQQHYPSREFIMNVIRNSNSTGEEMFDIRSESTGSGNIQYNKNITIKNSNQPLQRCHSIGSESDAYSHSVQNSICYSDSGYPIATKTSNSFQQMVFDDKFKKITAITKSETGSHMYSDLAKAATILTKVLSPDPNLVAQRTNTTMQRAPPPPPPPHSHMVERSAHKLNMPSYENVDTMSCASTHSGRSRSDYLAAIRAKAQSPTKTKKLHATVMSNMGPSAGNTISTTTTPISIANATFSNSVRVSDKRSDFSFERITNTKTSMNTDPFMMARDFNVTEFTTNNETDNDDDPFQIGTDVIGSGSDDDAWNVNTNSFPYLGSASASVGGSQYSKVDDSRSMRRQSFTDQVGKANSMDDALIESIRIVSAAKSATKQSRDERGRDNSPHEVRISHSEGDLDYPVALPDSYRGSGVGRVGDYYYSGPNMQQLKKRNTTKGVPANAIIGSMLFRQTQTCDEYCHEGELARNTKKNASHSLKKNQLKESPKSGGLEEVGDHLNSDEAATDLSRYKVPRNVHTECSKSDVSSVTEEASSFYTKNLMQHKWHQPAQNILNHYNVQRGNKMTLQSRDMNAATR